MTDSAAGSARHSLTVATIVVAIALCCAAAVGGGTIGPSPGNTAASAPSSLLTKLPQPQLPKFPVIYTYGKYWTPRPQTTNLPNSPVSKQPQSYHPAPQPQKQSQRPPQPQKQSQRPPQQPPQKSTPKPTTDERPAGRDPLLYQSPANASVTTSPRPKLETTTHDRAIITAPLKACPDGQRMGPDRNCRPDFPDPEGD